MSGQFPSASELTPEGAPCMGKVSSVVITPCHCGGAGNWMGTGA